MLLESLKNSKVKSTKEHGTLISLMDMVSALEPLKMQSTSIFTPCLIFLGTYFVNEMNTYDGEFKFGMKDGKITYASE